VYPRARYQIILALQMGGGQALAYIHPLKIILRYYISLVCDKK
jgi:hypothetical protein